MSVEVIARRRLRFRLAFSALVTSACLDFSSSLDDTQIERTPARYLDGLCATGAYELEGDARRTTGLTGDSCGFALGPGPSAVRFDTDASSVFAEGTARVLVADADGNSIENPRWEALAAVARVPGEPPPTADYEYRVEGRATYIVDIELERSSPPYSVGCAIVRRPKR